MSNFLYILAVVEPIGCRIRMDCVRKIYILNRIAYTIPRSSSRICGIIPIIIFFHGDWKYI